MTQHSAGTRGGFAVVAGSRPYPWPWDGRIDPTSLALLVIQAPGSAPRASGPIDTIGALADLVERTGGTVIEVITHPPFRRESRRASESGESSALTVVAAAAALVHSPGWNGFFDSTLDIELRRRGVTHLLLSGYWLEIGVHSTMRAGNDMGYECLLIEDAVAAADPELTPASLSSVEMSGGIFGAIATSAMVADAILIASSSHPLAVSTEKSRS